MPIDPNSDQNSNLSSDVDTSSNLAVSASFDWKRHPDADRLVRSWIDAFCGSNDFTAQLRSDLLSRTGTRISDWVDHLVVPNTGLADGTGLDEEAARVEAPTPTSNLIACGFREETDDQQQRRFVHDDGFFPDVIVGNDPVFRMAIEVESVSDFLQAHDVDAQVTGQAGSRFRRALVARQSTCEADSGSSTELHVCERHGWTRWETSDDTAKEIAAAANVLDHFRDRPRGGFPAARTLIQSAVDSIGVDWACDLFFVAEREYWQSKNHAAQVQCWRQDQMGLGWGNHDHHTYRSSRESFADLIGCLEMLGFHCRERFYAGGQAGWGAQVLEQSNTGIVIFADVDLSPEELSGDFSHDGLPARDQLGTVGLWCQLHGEAFLQAGMHHLECQFDFDAARRQLADLGVETMQPFTDFDHLRQAFTRGEIWPIVPARIDHALQNGWINQDQAETFRRDGAIGSHLEILQRNEGFKGFNQTGVSEIIRKTDPRFLQGDRGGEMSP